MFAWSVKLDVLQPGVEGMLVIGSIFLRITAVHDTTFTPPPPPVKDFEAVILHARKSHKVRESASQAVFVRMQLTVHATRRAPQGASRLLGARDVYLVGEKPTCSVAALWGCEGLYHVRLCMK